MADWRLISTTLCAPLVHFVGKRNGLKLVIIPMHLIAGTTRQLLWLPVLSNTVLLSLQCTPASSVVLTKPAAHYEWLVYKDFFSHAPSWLQSCKLTL